MGAAGTVYSFTISISDNDRAIYETLKFTTAQHPSESPQYLMARILAYCLEYGEGITFSHGLWESEEPAIWGHDLTGKLTTWVEIGTPSLERLHRATKAAGRVVVYLQRDATDFIDQCRAADFPHGERLHIVQLPINLLCYLVDHADRRMSLELSRSEGTLYLQCSDNSLAGELISVTL